MRALLFSLALTLAGGAARADIGWQVEALPPGSALVMQDRSGRLTHVARGMSGGLHVFDVHSPAGRVGRYLTNDRGEVVRTEAFDGAVTRYEPSRCGRTEGACSFTVVHPDGFREPRQRMTQATRQGLRFREYGLDGLVSEGALTLDASGTPLGGWTRSATGDETRQRSRRVALVLR